MTESAGLLIMIVVVGGLMWYAMVTAVAPDDAGDEADADGLLDVLLLGIAIAYILSWWRRRRQQVPAEDIEAVVEDEENN